MKPMQQIEKIILNVNENNKQESFKEIKNIIKTIIENCASDSFEKGVEFGKKWYSNKEEKSFIRNLLKF